MKKMANAMVGQSVYDRIEETREKNSDQETVMFLGQIASDSNGKLNAKSVMLQGDLEDTSRLDLSNDSSFTGQGDLKDLRGKQVPMDLLERKKDSRFPGQSSPKPKPGDLIKISRRLYSHWAIYMKDGNVIHLTPGTAEIKRDSLAKVVGSSHYSISNSADRKWKPLPIRQIRKMANAMVGLRLYYSVTPEDSKHFVHLLRYGKKKPNQAAASAAVYGILLLVVGVVNIYLMLVAILICIPVVVYRTVKRQLEKKLEDEYQSALPYLDLKRGYLIRINQHRNEHWAMYVGCGEIIHPRNGALAKGASAGYVIRREHLAKVAPSDHWKIDNSWDDRMEPLPKDKIIKKANAMIGHKIERNVNDFVKLIRYFEMPDSDPKPGDAIVILRPRFNQWAIYVGFGDIIYPDSEFGSGALAKGASAGYVIRREHLAKVATTDLWTIDNCWDDRMKPLPKDKIIKKANAMIGHKIERNVNDLIKLIRYLEVPSPRPQPGDKIQIFRTGYQHWAIYIGDGDVVHLTSDGACVAVAFGYSSAGSIAVIKREPLAKAIGNNRWHINNNSDRNWTPFPSDEIVERAISRIGERMRYKVLGANCEHFVNSVRYGINLSAQVEFAVGGACGVIVGGGLSVLAVPAAAATPVIAAVAGVASLVGHFGFQRILSRWLSR